MAGGEVDGAVDFAAANLASYCRSWCGAFAKQRLHAVIGEFRGGRARKLLGEKARVVRDEQRGMRIAAQHVFRDRRHRDAHIAEGKIFGNDAAPTGGSELYGCSRHWFISRRIVSWRRCAP